MKKSHQKSKKDHTMGLSAGDRERISTHCPPDMTETVKAALEEEIKAFDETPIRQEIETSASSGGSLDSYSSWLDNHGGQEPSEANPDTVSDEEGFRYVHSNKSEEVARLLKQFRQSLSPRQLQVWNLVMHHQMSLRETGKLLSLPKGTVQGYLAIAKRKFYRFAEDMRNGRQD